MDAVLRIADKVILQVGALRSPNLCYNRYRHCKMTKKYQQRCQTC